ncbi:MAG: malectin domain-containing carbohydrate-binding protein [Planctomycetia bacterium]|nr:malectin domain-containing carbohydrate-binding protein [Planctomycetia bacterium]
MNRWFCGLCRISFGMVVAGLLFCSTEGLSAATTQPRYYAHDAVEDSHGVVAPWYQGPDGQIDLRVRVAAEFLKRYPWVDRDRSVMAGPHYVFNARVDLSDDGTITVLPANDNMNGNLGQRFKYITESLPRYYRYSGDPIVFSHAKIAADFLLDYYQTGPDAAWPRFPISVPRGGKPYGAASPGGYIQLDLAAGIGKGMLRVYQLTGERRYFEAAKHWGDVFAEKCDYRPGVPPWGRYANPEDVPWGKEPNGNLQTGGVANVLLFLDELIRLGHTGKDGAITKARDAGRAYLRDTLLPKWYVWDTWGRHYWDWEHPVQGIVTTGWTAKYLMDNKDAFPNWRNDVRNILSLYFHHACVSPQSNGDVYSGAWAYPEGPSCCGRSLDVCPAFLARYLARYAAEADSAWAREIARREIILSFYHFHESGKCEDNIDGGQITANNWSELIGMGPILFGLETLEWLPELGPQRENHVLRASGVVTRIVYGKGRVEYSMFDAPAGGVDVVRLAFCPRQVTADGEALELRGDLNGNGYTVKPLAAGDCLVSIRHDGRASITVSGDDPQVVVDDDALEYEGAWRVVSDAEDFGEKVHVADSPGAAVTHRFHGNQVRVIGRAGPDGGMADIYLDGVRQPAIIDGWIPSTAKHRQVLYYRNGLRDGPHELRVVARGEKVPTSAGCNVYVDAVQSSAAVAVPDFGSGGGPTHAQRMIFGFTGREPYVDSSGNAWLPATEWVVRTGHHTDPVAQTWWTTPAAEPIGGTPDPELYRHGVHAPRFWVNVTVGPGSYGVRLKFAERRAPDDPKRLPMRVEINAREVVASLDVSARAGGPHKALDLYFDNIRPRNGIIEIRCTAPEPGEAVVQAIEVLPTGDVQRPAG